MTEVNTLSIKVKLITLRCSIAKPWNLHLNTFETQISFDWTDVEEDTVYLAHCYPYTYTDLRGHIDDIMHCPLKSAHVRKETLCETAAGNSCYLLTITNYSNDEGKDERGEMHRVRFVAVEKNSLK